MAAHRYWRFANIYNGGGANVSIAEIELFDIADLNTDVTGSGTASHSSTWSDPTYNAAKAVDNTTTTAWVSNGGGTAKTQWWAYDFGVGVAYDIGKFTLRDRSDGYQTECPVEFDL